MAAFAVARTCIFPEMSFARAGGLLLLLLGVLAHTSTGDASVVYRACFAPANATAWQGQVDFKCCTTCSSICWGVATPGGGYSDACQLQDPDLNHGEQESFPLSGPCQPKPGVSQEDLMVQLKKAAAKSGSHGVYSYIFNAYYQAHGANTTFCPTNAATLVKFGQDDQRCVQAENAEAFQLDAALDEVCSDKTGVFTCGKQTGSFAAGADAFAYAFSAATAYSGEPCDWEGNANLATWAERRPPFVEASLPVVV